LFYVACTRARHRLVVTAVRSPDDDGPRPSRFLDELAGGASAIDVVTDRTRRPLAMVPLVAELRRPPEDPRREAAHPAAAGLLAQLAVVEHRGRPLVPAADPSRWWGSQHRTDPGAPLYPADEPLALSGSSLDKLTGCPLKWYLGHEVHGEAVKGH